MRLLKALAHVILVLMAIAVHYFFKALPYIGLAMVVGAGVWATCMMAPFC